MVKKAEDKGGANSVDDEARALAPSPVPLNVFEPLDRDAPETWAAPRKIARVYVRPMSAGEIIASLGRLIPLSEKMEQGRTLAEIATDGFEELVAVAAVCTNHDADFYRDIDGADALSVFEAVYAANEAFFTRARILIAGKIGQKVRALFVGVGPTPSSISPSTESPTP